MKYNTAFYAALFVFALLFGYAVPASAIPVAVVADTSIPQFTITAIETTITAIIELFMKIKDTVLDPLAWVAAKTQIHMESNKIMQQVAGGGNPRGETGSGLFVSDWAKVGRRARQNTSDSFLKQLQGSDKINSAFKSDLLKTLSVNDADESVFNQLKPSFAEGEFEDFTTDFSKGGWAAWRKTDEEPGNDPYMSYFILQNEKKGREQAAATARRNEAVAGGGFLGTQKCDEEGKNCKITRPGSSVQSEFSKVMGSPIDTLQEANSFKEMLTKALGGFISKLRQTGMSLDDREETVADIESSREDLRAETRERALETARELAKDVNEALDKLVRIWDAKAQAYEALDEIPPGVIYEITTTIANVNAGGTCADNPEVYDSLDSDLEQANNEKEELMREVGLPPFDYANHRSSGPRPGNMELGGFFAGKLSQQHDELELLIDILQTSEDDGEIKNAYQEVAAKVGDAQSLVISVGTIEEARAKLRQFQMEATTQRQSRESCAY